MGTRVSFKKMIEELEMEELEGQGAVSKTSASTPPQFFSILCPSNQSLMGSLSDPPYEPLLLHRHCLHWTLITVHLYHYNGPLIGLLASKLTSFRTILPRPPWCPF